MTKEIHIPRKEWNLRPYQKSLWKAAIEGRNICAVWHRRQPEPVKTKFY